MRDTPFPTTFGPSTPGLLNLVAGTTYEGMIANGKSASGNIAGGLTTGAVIGDPDPSGDTCSAASRAQIRMTGQNVGDLLNAADVTWGSFMGGFPNCTHSSTAITALSTPPSTPPHPSSHHS